MTAKEAIYILRNAAWLGSDADRQKVEEAVEVVANAIEALECNGVAQERKYTFGNDEFNLEYAYHDCKLVFDGITDDDSFQEADTGLILYYANEIIYALHEALKGKDTNVPSKDIVYMQDAIDACIRVQEYHAYDEIEEIKALPPAQPENDWIPCTKKAHPDTPFRVQVQMDNGWIITAYYQDGEWLSVPDCGKPLLDKWIEAWRELPEPYQECEQDEH